MRSLNISTSALKSIQLALDTSSNNIANYETVGFKKRGVGFSELLYDSMENQPAQDTNRTSTKGLRIGSGVKVALTDTDLSQGNRKQTDVPTDFMIDGDGFFMVKRRGLDTEGNIIEQYRITRNGGFHLSASPADPEGLYNLVTSTGDLLVDDRGQDIEITQGKPFQVQEDGSILIDGSDVGVKIPVWKVDNLGQYTQTGDNEYIINIPVGEQPGNFMEQATSHLRQGALEMSNVDMANEMTQLMLAQRAYQLNARAIGINDQMMSIASSIRSR